MPGHKPKTNQEVPEFHGPFCFTYEGFSPEEQDHEEILHQILTFVKLPTAKIILTRKIIHKSSNEMGSGCEKIFFLSSARYEKRLLK